MIFCLTGYVLYIFRFPTFRSNKGVSIGERINWLVLSKNFPCYTGNVMIVFDVLFDMVRKFLSEFGFSGALIQLVLIDLLT